MGRMYRSAGLFAATLVLASIGPVGATPPETRATADRTAWELALDDAGAAPLANRNHGPSGRHGYILMDAVTGEVLSARNADETFIPASLAKIPTTLLTLAALGEEHRFATRLVSNGAVINGVHHGDLHLVGSGDPSLTSRDMAGLADQLAQQGIRRITGRLTFDASALPRTPRIDFRQPAGAHYNPAVGGLNIDHNLYQTGGTRRTLRKPGRWTALTLHGQAARRGVILPEPVAAMGQGQGLDIAVHHSAPVSSILRRMMKRSTNLTAEALGSLSIKAMGRAPGSLRMAATRTTRWLKHETGPLGGTEWEGFRLANHSGLSTRSRATPRQMAAILRLGYQRFGEDFSTLHRDDSPAGYPAYRMRGKIGTMRFVRGYAGFLTVGGREMIFAIMANDAAYRAMADADRTGLPAKAWMRQARRQEHDILSDWITEQWHPAPAEVVAMARPVAAPVMTLPVQTAPTYRSGRIVRATMPVE